MASKKSAPILSLKPTQFAVGMVEVDRKVEELRRLSARERERRAFRRAVPIFISPWGERCILDCHHFVLACWHVGVRRIRVKVVADFSRSPLPYSRFWRRMARLRFAHLYDQFGDGPRSPLYLPNDVRGLADDPYRSLAWLVRKSGAYAKTEINFSEFKWAGFFRRRKLLEREGRRDFPHTLKKAVSLARTKAARYLPGYRAEG